MRPRPTLIFDFGNVIAFFDYAIATERLGRPLGISGEALLRRARDAGLAEAQILHETGRISSAEFHRRFLSMTGLDIDYETFRAAWADIFRPNGPVHRLIAGLKEAGYPILLGSNTNEIHADHFTGQFADVLKHFDRLVLSHQIGAMKPSAEFYSACVAVAGRPPGESVFIDDLAENVEAARRAGLVGIRYTDPDALIGSLAEIGVSPLMSTGSIATARDGPFRPSEV